MVHIIEEHLQGTLFDSPIFSEYFSGMNVVVADIETTGLSPAKAAVVLAGAVTGEGGRRKAIQFFADTVGEERELLTLYARLLSRADVVVTFNGQRFDLPFLRARMERHKIDTSCLDRLYSKDIYRILKNHSHQTKILPNLKQKTVEVYLGDAADRKDEIDGAKSVELYYEYGRSSGGERESLRNAILLHNRDDIVRLADMMRILRTLNLHEILYAEGFPAFTGETGIRVEKIRTKKNTVHVQGQVYGPHASYRCFGDGYEFVLSGDSPDFELNIFAENISGSIVADTVLLNADCPSIREMGGYESGFLILKEGDSLNYREINALIKNILGGVLQ